MLFYIVMYRFDRNERARCVVRAANRDLAESVVLGQFDFRWGIEKVVRVDEVAYFEEL